MSGFANAILTLLLSWMRVLVNDLWTLFSSEDGSALYRFLAANWKVVVAVLCVGGFVVDRIIYLIRWRPYYVWSTKLGRLRRTRREGPEIPQAPFEQSLVGEETAPEDETMFYPPAGTQVFAPVATDFAPPSAPAAQETLRYAPLEQGPVFVPEAPPMEDLDPVFDDTEDVWAQGDALVRPLWDNPAEGMDASFGAPKPEPIQAIRDMQAGFARPLPPEELYAPPPVPPPAEPADAPVHPGLDADAFERFGLTQPPESLEDAAPRARAVMHAPAFHPFTMRQDAAPVQSGGALRRLAKRARDLMGVEDEQHRPTIHDLQSTVDVTQAFHEPVYPKRNDRQGGEE